MEKNQKHYELFLLAIVGVVALVAIVVVTTGQGNVHMKGAQVQAAANLAGEASRGGFEGEDSVTTFGQQPGQGGGGRCIDADGDGFSINCGVKDCNDNNANVNPGAAEDCQTDTDENCNPTDNACSCSDTDGGFNLPVRGTASFYNGTWQNWTDYCGGSEHIREHYCTANGWRFTWTTCGGNATCQNGECIPQNTTVCGDNVCSPEGGENVNTCPTDCPVVCGDGICSTPFESTKSCPGDCS